MEAPINTEANKYRTLADDPQYFGAYLNMARLNIFNINNHVAKELKLSPLDEEGKIPSSFLCNSQLKKANWNHIYSRTRRFFPVLKVFDVAELPKFERQALDPQEKDFALMSDTLKILFTELQEFRNDYSHYYSTEKGNTRKLKISDVLASFLAINFKRAIEYTKERFKGVFVDNDYSLVETKQVVGDDNTITTEGLVFLTCMFLEREYAFQFIGKIIGLKGTQYNSFLATREVLMAFCLRLPHDKFISDDPTQSFILDVANELNRCPGELYDVIVDEEKQKFRPQLDELKKRNVRENSFGEEVWDDDNYDSYLEAITRQVRFRNRFSEFALKFIDQTDFLGKYRFQIDLGKLQITSYPKSFAGEEIDRPIVENAKAFGKLADFGNEATTLSQITKDRGEARFEPFAPHYNTELNKIGLSRKSQPALLIPSEKRKAGFRLSQPAPEAFLSLHELQKIILLNYLSPGEAERLIDNFMLANNELITMPFVEKIKQQLPADWNGFERRADSRKQKGYLPGKLKYLRSRKETLNKVLEPYGLDDKQIPGRILDYWLNIKDVSAQNMFSDRIKLMRRDCRDRLKALRKFRKDQKGTIPKIGEMATFLARDIVDMIIDEKGKKKKITSFYYDKLQECLALFADPEKKATFIHTVTTELKLNEPGGHPFLFRLKLHEINRTVEFYELYLQEKAERMVPQKNIRSGKTELKDHSWIETTFIRSEKSEKTGRFMTVVKIPGNLSSIPFSIRQIIKPEQSLDQWLHDIRNGHEKTDKSQPVNLPTNLFDSRLRDLLQQALDTTGTEYSPTANWNELFKLWWKMRDDDTQPFYKAKREYMIYDQRICFEPGSKSKFSDYYCNSLAHVFKLKQKERQAERRTNPRLPDIQFSQVERVFKRTLAETEKTIRIIQEEDRTLLLMLEQLLGEGQDIKLSKAETLLNETKPIKQKVTDKLSFDDNGQELKGADRPEITRTITASRKQKDYTVLRKFIFDRRLPELFEYFSSAEISLDVLKQELDAYNKAKSEIFDTVFALEERLIATNAAEICQLFADNAGKPQKGNIQHKPYLHWLLKNNTIDEDTFVFLNMVRNCFSHNQFPKKKIMELYIGQWNANCFATTIASVYKQKITEIMEKF